MTPAPLPTEDIERLVGKAEEYRKLGCRNVLIDFSEYEALLAEIKAVALGLSDLEQQNATLRQALRQAALEKTG